MYSLRCFCTQVSVVITIILRIILYSIYTLRCMPYIDTPFGVFVLAPAAKFNFWSWGRHSYSFCQCKLCKLSMDIVSNLRICLYSKAVYLEVLVHDTPSCLGVPTDPDALCCEFVPHPGPVSPESRTSSFYVFAVVGDTCSNSVYSRPAATESSLIRKRLTVLSSEIVYSRPLAASESSFILTAAVISSKSSTLALYLRLPFFPPKYCAIHCLCR